MPVRDILLDIAPEFATQDEAALARIDRFIGYAQGELTADAWGAKLDMATALLAAHKLTLAGKGGSASGPVIAEKVGDMSVTYADPTTTNGGLDPLDASSYGGQFKQLRSTVYIGGILL
jgi:hypothetical protein